MKQIELTRGKRANIALSVIRHRMEILKILSRPKVDNNQYSAQLRILVENYQVQDVGRICSGIDISMIVTDRTDAGTELLIWP